MPYQRKAPPPGAAPTARTTGGSRYTNMTSDEFFDRYHPSYIAGYDPTTMSLAGKVNERLGGVNIEGRGLSRLRGEALRRGPSTWARMASMQSHAEEGAARDRGAKEVAGQTAQARSQLAMRGGLTSGARERVATAGARGYLDMSQDTSRQGALARGKISMEDESNRMGALKALPGLEMQQSDLAFRRADALTRAEMDDRNQLLAERERQNRYNMDTFGIQGSMFGAEKTAIAQEKANEGCWLMTGLADHGMPVDGDRLYEFKMHVFRRDLDLAKFYIRRCKPLVENMKKAGFDWSGLAWFHRSMQQLLDARAWDAAFELWKSTGRDLIDQFWPECPSKEYTRLQVEYLQRAAQPVQAPRLSTGDQPLFRSCMKLGAPNVTGLAPEGV